MKPRIVPFGGGWICESREGRMSYSGGGITQALAYLRWCQDLPLWRRAVLWWRGKHKPRARTDWKPTRRLPPAPAPEWWQGTGKHQG